MTLTLGRPAPITRRTLGASGITLTDTVVILRPGSGSPSSESRDLANADFLRQRMARHLGVIDNDTDSIPAEFMPVYRENAVVTSTAGNTITTNLTSPVPPFYICLGFGSTASALGVTEGGVTLGGVKLRTVGNALILAGYDHLDDNRDTEGNRRAVLMFCEDVLGYRCFWPGALGEIVPEYVSIPVPEIDTWHNPVLQQRQVRGGGVASSDSLARLGFTVGEYTAQQADGGFGAWYGKQYVFGGSLYGGGSHGFTNYWDSFGASHPAWFAVQDPGTGSRDQAAAPSHGRARMCKANLELIDHKAAEAIAALNADPTVTIELGSNDGGEQVWCTCTATLASTGYPSTPGCRTLDPPNTEGARKLNYRGDMAGTFTYDYPPMSDRQLWFWNAVMDRVRAVHPDARFLASAYSYSLPAPYFGGTLRGDMSLLVVSVLAWARDYTRDLTYQDWEGWKDTGPTAMFLRPNSLLGESVSAALFQYGRPATFDLKRFSAQALRGTDYDGWRDHWAVAGFGLYCLGRAMWNPAVDVNDIIKDFTTKAFGPAAPHMEAYLRRADQVLIDVGAIPDDPGPPVQVRDGYTPAVNAELLAHLVAADAATSAGVYKDRVAFYRAGFDWHSVTCEVNVMYQAYLDGSPPSNAARDELGNRRYALMLDIFESHHHAVNVTYAHYVSPREMELMGWVNP